MKRLSDSLGIVSVACKAVGIARNTFYDWRRKDETFRAQVDEINETALDFVESKMFEAINKGDVRMIQFFLTTKGRKRGYAPKVELGNAAISIEISNDEAEY